MFCVFDFLLKIIFAIFLLMEGGGGQRKVLKKNEENCEREIFSQILNKLILVHPTHALCPERHRKSKLKSKGSQFKRMKIVIKNIDREFLDSKRSRHCHISTE